MTEQPEQIKICPIMSYRSSSCALVKCKRELCQLWIPIWPLGMEKSMGDKSKQGYCSIGQN